MTSWRKGQKETTLTAYYEVLNYLLETYATHEVIIESDAETSSSFQHQKNTLIAFATLL